MMHENVTVLALAATPHVRARTHSYRPSRGEQNVYWLDIIVKSSMLIEITEKRRS